jgi:autotransporter-associated beta strand protein
MKNKLSSLFLSSVAASSILLAPALHAANGTWNVDANGLWGTSANWLNSIVANDSNSIAYFTNDITADRTVSLNADYTLNSLVFGDGATGSAGSWILDNSGNSNNNLILAGTTPGITVNALGTGKTATISAIIEGTNGLVKNGNGTLTLSGTNTYTGRTTVNAGTLNVTARVNQLSGLTLADVAGATFNYSNAGSYQIFGLSGGGANGGNLASTAGFLLTANATNNIYGGILSGAGFIEHTGNGTQTLSGMNTYSGKTKINNGTLSINSISSVNGGDSSLGKVTNVANGTIDMGTTTTTGTLLYTGTGHSTDRVVNLLGTTGGATLNASGSGALVFSNAFTATGAGNKTLTLTGTNTADNRIGGAIVNSTGSGTTSLTKSGTGNWVLSGENTYTGATTISGGTLTVSGTGKLGSGSYAGAIANSGVFNYASTANQTLSGIISGAGAVTKSGTGTLTLSGTNTYNGTTTINAGTLKVTGALRLGLNSSVNLSDVAGATLDFSGASGSGNMGTLSGGGTNGGDIVLNTGTVYIGNLQSGNASYGGIISGNGNAAFVGTGTQTLTGTNSSYTGKTGIGRGTLSVSSISSLGSGNSSVGSGNARFDIGDVAATGTLLYTGTGHSTDRVVNLGGSTGGATLNASGSGALVFTSAFSATVAGAKTLTLTGTNTSTNRVGGAIVNSSGGATSLTKSGTGKWVLSGANTYTGATTIDNGQLIINGTNTASAVTVTNTGTLGGSGSVGAVTVASGGTIDPGNSPGTLKVQSSIWNNGGNYNWQLYDATGAAGTGYDTITSTGSLDLSGLISGGFNINLWTINSLSSTNGSAINFVDTGTYNWVLGTFGTITGFDANKININTGATNGTGGFANTFTGGTFRISTNGSGQLLLNYQGAPAADSPVWIGGSGNLSTIGTTNGSAMVFTGATGGNVTNNQVSSLASMTFSNGAGAITFSGDAVTNGIGGIVNNSAVTQTVSLPLNLGTNQTFDAASGNLAISGNVTNNGNTLTLTGSSNTVVSGDITGAGGLTKTGTGIATLNVAQSFTGRTTVSQGTLALGAGASLASTNINLGTLAGQGTLDVTALSGGISIGVGQTLAGYGTVKGNTTIASGGTLAPGNSPGILNFDGNLTLNSNSTSIFEVAGLGGAGATNGFDQALVSGDLTYGGDLKISIAGSYNNATGAFGGNIFQFGVDRNSGSFNTVQYSLNGSAYADLIYHDASNTWQIWNDAFLTQADNGYIGINLNTGYLTVVPEPASWALFVGGVSTVLIFRRRKNS